MSRQYDASDPMTSNELGHAMDGRQGPDFPDDALPTSPEPDGYAIWREQWERQHGGLSQAEAESAERFWSEC